ncbi:MAG: pyrroloquinoline quinone biosynthesis peptide chaperone PqqD [Microcoleus sp. SM1_3_4]|nr:pyrroloquinoline quinone biosynthesis peptide chaperone PqqD [Microcoleus sp. SM1_3_4]
MNANSYPHLACGVRLFWDEVRQQHFLLFPEGAVKLNKTAWAILKLCDRTIRSRKLLQSYQRSLLAPMSNQMSVN